MSRLVIAAAAFVFVSTSAFAGDTYDFKIGGQSFHIEQPRDCNSASCVSVSIPGIYESGPKRRRNRPMDDDDQANIARDKKDSDIRPAPIDTAPAASAAAPSSPSLATAPTTSDKSLEPANGAATAPMPRESVAPVAPSGGLAPPVVASVPPAPAALPSDSASVANSPLGVWLTEEKEGKVRIETCGSNLCGYSIDAKTNANGDKVLINMKPGGDKWTGRIHDPKGGSTYDSTIAMKGSDRLRVQGCAFGGMFCGGQTWTRIN